ncbi:helix-turn-helix transcriptional regulator [uncultured Clostridium sp.]|uniref:helix-turn-helix transcriptional regulator n=1 Tax=uncultured Clostridium sp. TaxID=59620 RepID=UPI000822362C|nr:helix-turn-helix transcriptional regulator [uncultured Clostridium sp.]SCJ50469.1 Predicted transcriptional regulator [uncultured Clostridium sp.]
MNLRNLRNERGLRRSFVANMVGICGKHLNDIERGRVNLTQKVAEKLADVYQLDIEEIFKLYKEGQNYE